MVADTYQYQRDVLDKLRWVNLYLGTPPDFPTLREESFASRMMNLAALSSMSMETVVHARECLAG